MNAKLTVWPMVTQLIFLLYNILYKNNMGEIDMIDIMVVDQAVKLKKEADAAYLVFKRTTTVENSARWTSAARAYNDY